jgi:23S rRNA C2498 (ribose-2'-O)-methylase RlmM
MITNPWSYSLSLSVSINPVNGYLFTLTAKELRVYTINGDLLAMSLMADPSNTKPKAKVVMALPIGEWQDGFVADYVPQPKKTSSNLYPLEFVSTGVVNTREWFQQFSNYI